MLYVAANQKMEIENVQPDTTKRYNDARGVQSLYACYLTCVFEQTVHVTKLYCTSTSKSFVASDYYLCTLTSDNYV